MHQMHQIAVAPISDSDAVAAEVVVSDCLLQQVAVVYFVAVEELSDHSAD